MLRHRDHAASYTDVVAEWATVLFVVQLSLGESIWSPRWYDYSMSIAPEGREGVFTAMASAPLFLGKFVTGIHSAILALSVSSADCKGSMQQRDERPIITH